ncbi:ferric uptake regulator family protein [Pseudopedobacter saltans DSM 12145]|uniref:Ferric uptake regulator family protein n=1 Tax=Pseudopedobacter saltans (strain ATCC 51119 / DSM 12145 / JCM 21818 / CCUG 39354 / LMG 10337 / NBRC 100064 / NCIMB 13643) TaxID=762903 RepID=F0SAH0_PSESL|nr:transcriptional repressor [Pseudopedobacter saltans]ADY52590.1 ferric uptake regulator family protein [Pseudopedobacter saltans DSM 12145]
MSNNTAHILDHKHISPTPMRQLVLDTLLNKKSALSINDIEKMLYPADRITIYRTLKTFEQKGLIHQVEDGSGSLKYALCQDSCDDNAHHDVHVHFSCKACKETFCLPKNQIPKISLPQGYQPEEISLTVKGVCKDCQITMQ